SAAAVALYFALAIGFAPHFAVIGGLVVVAAAFGKGRAGANWLALILALSAAMSAYLIVGTLFSTGGAGVGTGEVAAFRTTGPPQIGLYGNVLAMYGFWRREAPLPRDSIPGWPFLLVAILLVVITGIVRGWRSPDRKRTVVPLLAAGVVGYFLALGNQG